MLIIDFQCPVFACNDAESDRIGVHGKRIADAQDKLSYLRLLVKRSEKRNWQIT